MTALDIFTYSGTLVISSETIAEGADTQHASVIRLIDDNLPDFEDFGLVGFEIRARSAGQHGGGDRRVALLNEQQATLLMTFQRNTEQVRAFKKALVRAFFDMARQAPPALPQSYAEALRELAQSVEQTAALTAKVEADAPKVDYVDTFVADGDLRLLRAVAKDLNMAEGALRDDLLARKWIYKETATRWSERKQEKETVCRYSPYADKVLYFQTAPAHEAPRFKGEVMHTLKVTPQGAVAIARLYRRPSSARA